MLPLMAAVGIISGSVTCSGSEENRSAYADRNHAPSLTCAQREFIYIVTS